MKAFKIMDSIMEKLCAILMVVMCLSSFAQVANRFLFHRSFIWTDEIVLFSMVWVTFFGSALAVSRNTHTRIDFFISLFSPKVRSCFLAVSNILCAGFCVALAYISLPVFRKNMKIYSSGLHLPNAISYFAVIFGCVIMVIYFLMLAGREFGNARGNTGAAGGEKK